MTKRRIVRSAVSVFLSFALVLSGIMPGTPLVKTVQAAEEETEREFLQSGGEYLLLPYQSGVGGG